MNTTIFAVGLFVFSLLAAGLILSVLEVKRLERRGPRVNERFPL